MGASPRRVNLSIETTSRVQVVDITARVEEAVRELGIEEGTVHVFCPHTTGAVAVNEAADPDVATDIGRALSAMVPDLRFAHAEGNAPAHLLATLVGPSELLPVLGGRLGLGTWQGVFFCEFDGPRSRTVWVMGRP